MASSLRGSGATRVVVGLAVVSLAMAACGTSTPSATLTPGSTEPSVAPSTAETIDNIKIAGAGPVLTLDHAAANDLVSVDTIMLTQGSLYRHDAAGTPRPELADGLEISADGLTVTVKLKANQKYSDDTPVTAADIKAAIDRAVEAKAGGVASVNSVDVVDDLTAILNLKYPDPDLLLGLTSRYAALNPVSKLSDPDYYLHPVSAGPYMVTEYTPNKSIHLDENPNYVGGPMVVKSIDVMYVPDATSKVLQLATGELDFVIDLPIPARDSLPPEVKQFVVDIGGINVLYLNMDPNGKAGTKFADVRVRQAMSLALDRQAIADTAFAGTVQPATSFWGTCAFCPEGMLPNGGVQDLEAAKSLMTAAGVGPEGISATLEVSSTRGGWKDAATLVASQLEAIGVHFSVNPVDEATVGGDMANKNYEALFIGAAGTAQAGTNSFIGNGYSAAHCGYDLIPDHDKVADLIAQMAQELDVDKRKDLMTQVQLFARDTMPMITLVNRIALDGTRLPLGVISVSSLTPGYIVMQTVAEQAAGKAAGS